MENTISTAVQRYWFSLSVDTKSLAALKTGVATNSYEWLEWTHWNERTLLETDQKKAAVRIDFPVFLVKQRSINDS